ncbi:MAG: ATP-binding protein [Acholeplasmatales bacterium]|nr:ATP-binding protein [Acholeplasmatales bacterium]
MGNYDNQHPSNYLNGLSRQVMNNKFSIGIIDNAKMVGGNKLKNLFGKEFYIGGLDNNIDGKINIKLMEFFKKYDKQFSDHFDYKNNRLVPFVSVSIIDPRTYMFIATKQNVPGKLELSIMNDSIAADAYVYIMGKHSRKYSRELEDILAERTIGQRNDVIYSVNSVGGKSGTDISCINLSQRKMDSLIYSNNELDIIRDHMDKFSSNKDFYMEKELSYKTGMLFYGRPGTGKSSLVKAIATEYHRGIISIDVSNIDNIDFARLTMMINNEDKETYIVLFEDIDTLFLNREEGDKHDKNYNDIINKLLQFLDSNQSPSNVVFIATTNHLDRLDEALIRDGRFDLKIEIGELKKADIARFLTSFDLDPSLTNEIVKEYIEAIAKKENKDPSQVSEPKYFNQSRLQNIILRHIKFEQIKEDNPDITIDDIKSVDLEAGTQDTPIPDKKEDEDSEY